MQISVLADMINYEHDKTMFYLIYKINATLNGLEEADHNYEKVNWITNIRFSFNFSHLSDIFQTINSCSLNVVFPKSLEDMLKNYY